MFNDAGKKYILVDLRNILVAKNETAALNLLQHLKDFNHSTTDPRIMLKSDNYIDVVVCGSFYVGERSVMVHMSIAAK